MDTIRPQGSPAESSEASAPPTSLSVAEGTVEFVKAGPEFLPLTGRRVLYVLSLVGLVAAPVLAVTNPDYAVAITTGAGILGSAALGTALANPSR